MNTSKSTALITGASSGIGLEMARQLAAAGHSLVLVARSADRLNELAESLRSAHRTTVWTLPIDLSQSGAAEEVHSFTKSQGITVELLINNAGVGLYGEHSDLDPVRLAQMLQLNVTTLTELSLLYGAEMRARKSGRILNIASTAAYQPTPYFAAYGASKTFVLHFSEALAKELEDYGVSVSCYSPGPTETAFFKDMDARTVEVDHFKKTLRDDASWVAKDALRTMMHGELSRMAGTLNWLRATSARLAPRWAVAKLSKQIMRPKSPVRSASPPRLAQ